MVTFGKFNLQNYKNCFIVTDETLSELYGIAGDSVFLLPCGEQAKNLQQVERLCAWLLDCRAEKGDTVVAVGGGSVGDTAGFAASVYKRGIKLLHVPTTLVAQIDSAIGGKTAVDLNGVKNVLGTFYAADTFIDVYFLKTLDETQWKNGRGELLKYRMLDGKINDVFLRGDLRETIKACVEFKQKVCEADPFDENQRKILNFGHTVGHAMELSLGLGHGEAVANGLYYETLIARELGLCSDEYLQTWRAEIERVFPLRHVSEENLLLAAQDKKNRDGKVCLVLPRGGKFELRYLPLDKIIQILCND